MHKLLKMKRALFLLLTLFTLFQAKSQEYENLQVSLLTVEPRSNAVYTIFGHTALRLYDPTRDIDAVFNWGIFSFNKPNFLFLFIKGETDYRLGTYSFTDFKFEYSFSGSTVVEQVLNIPEEKKAELIQILSTNLLPENIEYRYNYFFDNCTSRVRDIIEKVCGVEIIYPEQTEPTSFRTLIHECTEPYPWLEFGIDLLIGSGADSLVSYRNELWLPLKLKEAMDNSDAINAEGYEYPMVLSSHIIMKVKQDSAIRSPFWTLPVSIGFLIFIIYLGILFAAYKKKRRYRFPFALLFLIAGIGGCIIATTCFFSIHPCTWPNWNILWIHPLHLIGFAGFIPKRVYRWSTWYHGLNFVILSLVLLAWHWIPQGMNIACIPFILSLWAVSGFQVFVVKKKLYD